MDLWPLKELGHAYHLNIQYFRPQGNIMYLETNRGKFALKHSTLSQEELELEYRVCEHLCKNGYQRLARIEPTSTGRSHAQIGNHRFILSNWVEGRQCDFSDPAQLELAVRNLAKFHLAARHFPGKVPWQKRMLYGIWPQRFSFRLGHIQWYRQCVKARGVKEEFDELFMSHVDHAIAEAKQAIDRLCSGTYYSLANQARKLRTICHHDYAHHNILIDASNNAWLLDFDYCILDLPLHDLASLILRVVKFDKWRLEPARRILCMYHEEKKLAPGALDTILNFLRFPQDFWQIAWAKYNEHGMHRPDILLLRLKKYLAATDARDDFLQQLALLANSPKFLPGRDTL